MVREAQKIPRDSRLQSTQAPVRPDHLEEKATDPENVALFKRYQVDMPAKAIAGLHRKQNVRCCRAYLSPRLDS